MLAGAEPYWLAAAIINLCFVGADDAQKALCTPEVAESAPEQRCALLLQLAQLHTTACRWVHWEAAQPQDQPGIGVRVGGRAHVRLVFFGSLHAILAAAAALAGVSDSCDR